MACSCLLANPPDYDDAEDHWPVFVRTDPAGALVEVDLEADDFPAGLVSSFGAVARDGNLDQDLLYRWFLDYSADAPDRQFCGRVDQQRLRPTGAPERTVASPIGQWPYLLEAGRCHRLTLVATDGEFAEAGCAAVVEPSHRISTDWWLGVRDTDNPLTSVDFTRCLSQQEPLSR